MLGHIKETLYKIGKFSEFGEQYPELSQPKLLNVVIEKSPQHNARLALVQHEHKMYWVNVSGTTRMSHTMLMHFAKKIGAPLSYEVVEAWKGEDEISNPKVLSMLFDLFITNDYQDVTIPLNFKEQLRPHTFSFKMVFLI